MSRRSFQKRLVALGRDRQSGAAEIARQFRDWLAEALEAGQPPLEIARASATLIAAQPAMAPLYGLANAACLGVLPSKKKPRPLRLAQILPARRSRVMTYSYSSTVKEALCLSRKRIRSVVCSEARPGREGIRLAKALARAGLEVTLLTEAAMMSRLNDVDLVVVGADALLPGGVINKVGTVALSRLARGAGRPFYILAGREKILASAFARFVRLPARPGAEIARAGAALRVENPLFDFTPYRLLSGVLTEKGLAQRRDLLPQMRAQPVSAILLRALDRQMGLTRHRLEANPPRRLHAYRRG